MIQQARIEVRGNEVTIVVVTSTPEEAQRIAGTSARKLEATGVELAVVEEDAE